MVTYALAASTIRGIGFSSPSAPRLRAASVSSTFAESRLARSAVTRSICFVSSAGSIRRISSSVSSRCWYRLTPTMIRCFASTSTGSGTRRLRSRAGRVLLDRGHHAAERADPVEVLVGLGLGAGLRRSPRRSRSRRAGRSCSRRPSRARSPVAQRQSDRVLGRQRQRPVERVRVERLRPAEHRRESLESGPDDVHLRLLRGQRHARGLGVEASATSAGSRRNAREAPGPDPPRRPVLGDLLEEVEACVEEERDVAQPSTRPRSIAAST